MKRLARHREYGDMESEMIRDQMVDQCASKSLRRSLLREEKLTLEMVQRVARAMEAADLQVDQMKNFQASGNSVCSLMWFVVLSMACL